jgi:hypothetical protein
MEMRREAMEFWERAATAALTGLCGHAAGIDVQGAAAEAAVLADALLAERQHRDAQA